MRAWLKGSIDLFVHPNYIFDHKLCLPIYIYFLPHSLNKGVFIIKKKEKGIRSKTLM